MAGIWQDLAHQRTNGVSLLKKALSGNRRSKAGIAMTALPIASKFCSTCAFWGGARVISPGGYIKIHPYSKGECQGIGYKHLSMAALAACDEWELITIAEAG